MTFITPADWAAIWLTLKLALASTLLLMVFGTPVAWFLASSKWRYKHYLEAVIALPLVVPPTVLGFYLLVTLSGDGVFGRLASSLGLGPLAFSFTGLVIGSAVYSMPFVIQPMQQAFLKVGQSTLEVAATLGAGPVDRFFSVVLPQAKNGLITAAVLGFAHTVGEFGVVLMIGGNIPEKTQVLSIAIYDHVESMNYAGAHSLSAVLLVFSFAVLVLIYSLNKKTGLLRT